MGTDPEVEAFLGQERSRRLRLAAIGLGIVAAGVGGYFALRPAPCERVVDRVCQGFPGPECAKFRDAVTRFASTEKCKEALDGLDVADSLPETFRLMAMSAVILEMVGQRPETERDLEDAGSH